MRVIVLGAGPAGLLAAHAVRRVGYHPIIVSVKKPSPIGGAQYLHRSIPDLTPAKADGVIDFQQQGSSRGYCMKVYGRMMGKDFTSWSSYAPGEHECWNLRGTYNKLWDMYADGIVNMQITPVMVSRLIRKPEFAAVVSTIPLKAICMNKYHFFAQKDVYISQDADWLTKNEHRYLKPGILKNTILWNGEPDVDWYRQSFIFGFPGTEWPQDPKDRKVVKVTKPLWTNCTCWPGMIRAGRYGQWTKGVLAHHAYEETIRQLTGKIE